MTHHQTTHGRDDRGPSKAICILGMHRSGTSAIARAVNLLGPHIGSPEHLMKPIEGDNPHGFWENLNLYRLHEKILSYFSGSWDSIVPLPEGWWKEPGMGLYREELRNLILSEFAGHALWMWKDPRTSLLLPLWKEVMKELGIEVDYLLCVRNPLDVAASLSRRNNLSKDKSLALWLLHNASGLLWTNGEKRMLVNYDDLIEDWEPPLRKISTTFGIPWPQDEEGLRASMKEFLRPEDRHSLASAALLLNDRNVAEAVKEMYRLLLEALEHDDVLNSERFKKEVSTMYYGYHSYAKVFIQSCATDGLRLAGKEWSFPLFENPRASIIIPVWNQWKYTSRCLQALLENSQGVPYEVIIVDNGSSDETVEMLKKIGRVKVVRNESNTGYVHACNQGAEIARGEFLVFLNNDTEAQPGWLRELAAVPAGDETVGAVGARIIYPSGLLQEAGGMIFTDGRSWTFGRGDNPDEEIYDVMCEVDYCSAACLLVRRDLFVEVGGFDTRYSPAYYEDTDLCFSLRQKGYKVIYNPDVCIIHHESVTAGTDESSGFRKYLAINREKFIEKWAAELTHQDASPWEGSVPVMASRERLVREGLTQEDLIYRTGRSAAQKKRPLCLRIDKSVLYRSMQAKQKKAEEVAAEAVRRYGKRYVGVVWSGGKDVAVLLHVIRQAFAGRIPVKVICLMKLQDSPEEYRFIEDLRREWGFELRTLDPATCSSRSGTVGDGDAHPAEALFQVAVKSFDLKALLTAGGTERTEIGPGDVYFSHEEDPRYVRVRPLLHFREADLWHYIMMHNIPLREIARKAGIGFGRADSRSWVFQGQSTQ